MFAMGYYELFAASPQGPFDFDGYDALFIHRESDETRCVIALSRLAAPKHLGAESRARYQSFLRRTAPEALRTVGRLRRPAWMPLLSEAGGHPRGQLRRAAGDRRAPRLGGDHRVFAGISEPPHRL